MVGNNPIGRIDFLGLAITEAKMLHLTRQFDYLTIKRIKEMFDEENKTQAQVDAEEDNLIAMGITPL